jgi:transposase-like protein
MIRDASSHEQGKQLAATFISRYKNIYPSPTKIFREELEALLNHLKIPVRHRRNVRTTNLIERSFEEEKRRTN